MNHESAKAFIDSVPDDEPVFVIRAQDRFAPFVMEEWLGRAIAARVGVVKLIGVLATLYDMVAWRAVNHDKVKVPD